MIYTYPVKGKRKGNIMNQGFFIPVSSAKKWLLRKAPSSFRLSPDSYVNKVFLKNQIFSCISE